MKNLSHISLTNARLLDPASGREEPGSIFVCDGLIADIARGAPPEPPEGVQVIDCRGAILAPGLVDLRAFVGEPGAEHRETLKTASEAAAAGGVTFGPEQFADWMYGNPRGFHNRLTYRTAERLSGEELTRSGLPGHQ